MRHVQAVQSSNQLPCSRATSTRVVYLVGPSGNDRSIGSVPILAGSGLFSPRCCCPISPAVSCHFGHL